MTESVVRTLDDRNTNLRGAQATKKQITIVVFERHSTHYVPMCCYPTESAQWSLWVLHEIERESKHKS